MDGTSQNEASLSSLRNLYLSEKDSLMKVAPALTHRALFPNNFERQNVKLVLKLLDEKTVCGLKQFGQQNSQDVSGTVKFLEIISRLWRILNVKSVDKGRRKRDAYAEPIHSLDSDSYQYLVRFQDWLTRWDALQQKVRQGRLSNETFFALKHTVGSFVELIKYLLRS